MEELQTIKLNAIIDIQVSQSYYVQLQSIVVSLIKSLKPEELKESLKNIENNANKTLLDDVLKVLSTLLVDIEINAKNQNKLEPLNLEKFKEPGDISGS
jgi:hypothetical protein